VLAVFPPLLLLLLLLLRGEKQKGESSCYRKITAGGDWVREGGRGGVAARMVWVWVGSLFYVRTR